MVRCYVNSLWSCFTHLALCPLRALLLYGPRCISRRHRHWYCRALSASRRCPTEVFCRPACRRQCAPFLFQLEHECPTQPSPFLTVNTVKTQTVPDPCLSSIKVRPVVPARVPGTPPPPEKSKTALNKRKADLEPSDGEPMCTTESIKLPVVIALERQQREKQDGVDLRRSDSDSDVPLAKKHVAAKPKRECASAGTLAESNKCKEDRPQPPKKRSKSKVKAPLRPAEDPPDQATNVTETVGTGLREKITSNTDSETTARIGADLNGRRRNAQVLQEKTVPMKVPRKRKDYTEAAPDKDDGNNNEDTHHPPKKKRRRANNTARCAFLFLSMFFLVGSDKVDCVIQPR